MGRTRTDRRLSKLGAVANFAQSFLGTFQDVKKAQSKKEERELEKLRLKKEREEDIARRKEEIESITDMEAINKT